jgi:glycine cleavage system H protein
MATLSYPAELKYTRTDEWIRVEGDKAFIGITDYAQDALSDVVFVELPSVGSALKAGGTFGTVESVKAASELKMPIGGTVTAVNSDLEGAPETVNAEPYGKGWFIQITPENLSELDALMDAAAYEAYCQDR